MKKKITYILFILVTTLTNSFSQYFPIFSQYISNGLVINPAYTGSREVLSLNFMYRNQMTGFEGAPVYETFTVHAPLKNPRVGVGFMAFNEKAGPTRNTQAYATYAYRIRFVKGRLSLGLKAGINYGDYNWKNVYTNDSNDPAFSNKNNTFILPNIGAGIYYYSKKFFTGISVPYFLTYKESSNRSSYDIVNDIKNYNFLITAGYLLNFSRGFKLKPSCLVKYYTNSQEQVDLNLNFILLNDKLWLGTAYRLDEAMAGILEVQLSPQFRAGYTYEYAGKTTSYFNYTSHEITLRYEFSYKIKAFNPRYF